MTVQQGQWRKFVCLEKDKKGKKKTLNSYNNPVKSKGWEIQNKNRYHKINTLIFWRFSSSRTVKVLWHHTDKFLIKQNNKHNKCYTNKTIELSMAGFPVHNAYEQT